MSPPTVDVSIDGKRSSSKSNRSPLKKKNVIVEHFSRCDKVEVDLSSYEKETESALLKLPSHLQIPCLAESFNSPNPEQLDGHYYDDENGLHTPEEVASDGDTFFTPQSAVRSISKRSLYYQSQEGEYIDEERTPLGSTSCAKSAFDRDELEVSFKEIDEVSERLNKSLMSHLGSQRNTISVYDRVKNVQEELNQNELNSEWKSPQKRRPGFESEYIAERQSLPHNFATGSKYMANRSLREEGAGLSHIREDQVASDKEDEDNHKVQTEAVEDMDSTPTKEKSDISRAKALGYQLQQSVNNTEITDQMEIQLDNANEAGDVVQLTAIKEAPVAPTQGDDDLKHNKSVNLEDVLNNISLHDCSLVDNVRLQDSGRRFRNVQHSSESSSISDNNGIHTSEPVTVPATLSERLYRQKAVNKYVANLGKWYEVERMRINSRGVLTERERGNSTRLIKEAKMLYESRSSLVQSLVNDSMSQENFKFLMEEMTTLLNNQVKTAVEEVSTNCELIRHNMESTRKRSRSVTRNVGTSMTPHSPRTPVALETADLDKSVELRRWSLHEKPAVTRSVQSLPNGSEPQKKHQHHVSENGSLEEESFVLGVSGAVDKNERIVAVIEKAQREPEMPASLTRTDDISTELIIKDNELIVTQDVPIETSQVNKETGAELPSEVADELPFEVADELPSELDGEMQSEEAEDLSSEETVERQDKSSIDVSLRSVDDLFDMPTMDIESPQNNEGSSAQPSYDPSEEPAFSPEVEGTSDLHVKLDTVTVNEAEILEVHQTVEEPSDELLQTQPGSDLEGSTQESLIDIADVDSTEDTGRLTSIDSDVLVDESTKLDTDRSAEPDAGFMGGDTATNAKEVRYRLDLSLLESSPEASVVKDELNDSLCKTPKGTDARLSLSFGSPRSSQSPLEKFSTKFVASPRQTSPVVAASPINTSLLDDEEDDFLSQPIKPVDSPMRQGALSDLSRQAYFEYASKNFSDPRWIEERISESCYLVWKDKEAHGYINSVDLISDFEKIAHQFIPVSSKYGEVRKEWREDIDLHRAQIYGRVRDIAADLWNQNNDRNDVFSGLPRTSKYSRKEPASITYQEFVEICRRNIEDSDEEKDMPPKWSLAYESSSFEKELATKMAKTSWEQTKEAVNDISNQIGSQMESDISTEVIENMASEYLRKKRDGWKALDSQIYEEAPKASSAVEIKKVPYIFNDTLDESLL